MIYHDMPFDIAMDEYKPFMAYCSDWDMEDQDVVGTFSFYMKDNNCPPVVYIVPVDVPIGDHHILKYMEQDEDNPFFLTPYFYADMPNPAFVFCPCSVNGKAFTDQWTQIETAIAEIQKIAKETP